MIFVIFHIIVHLKKQLPWQWFHIYNFVRRLQIIQTMGTSLHDLLEECVLGFKLKQNLRFSNWLLFKAIKQAQKQPNR